MRALATSQALGRKSTGGPAWSRRRISAFSRDMPAGYHRGKFLSFEGHACNEIAGRTYLCAKSTFLEEVHVDEERCPCHRCRLPVRIGRGVRRGQEGEEGRQQGHVCRRQRVQGARRVPERLQRLQGPERLQG